MTDKREIDLHTGETPRRRLTLNIGVAYITVPVLAPDGAGRIVYAASGLHAADGVEIWTPQRWERDPA